MNNNQFTEKSRQALQFAQQLTVEYKNQEVSQEHLAYALLSDEQGLIPQLLSKMGGNDIYLITAFVGHDASPEEIAALEEQVAQICPDAEFYTVDGGQDVYPFIFVVE